MINITKKKIPEKNPETVKIVLSILMIMALYLLVKEIYFSELFDPSKHVCEKEVCIEYSGFQEKIVDCDTPMSHGPFCKSWRPKTFCEKCLDVPYDQWHRNANNFIDAEGFCDKECKCTEYGETDTIVRGYPCPGSCITKLQTECVLKLNSTYAYMEVSYDPINGTCPDYYAAVVPAWMDKEDLKGKKYSLVTRNVTHCEQCYEYEQKCTKARPLTECEKGNEDYIVDENIITCISNSASYYDEYTEVNCQAACRKKTIQDYSCDELREAIWLDLKYCPDENKFVEKDILCIDVDDFIPFNNGYDTKTLKRYYMSMDCEI